MLVTVEAGEAVLVVHLHLVAFLLGEKPSFVFDAIHKDIAHCHQPGAGIRCERLGGGPCAAPSAANHAYADYIASGGIDTAAYSQRARDRHRRSFKEVATRCTGAFACFT